MRVNADKELPLRTPESLDQLLVYVTSLKVTAENRVGEVLLDKITGSSSIMAVQHHVELDLVLVGTCVVSERKEEERERSDGLVSILGKTFFRQRNSAKSFSKVHCIRTCISQHLAVD